MSHSSALETPRIANDLAGVRLGVVMARGVSVAPESIELAPVRHAQRLTRFAGAAETDWAAMHP